MSLLICSVDTDIQDKSLLKHKFYQMWSAGSLSIEELRGYSKEYFQLVKAVPTLVANVLGQVTPEFEEKYSPSARLKHNMEEEKEHLAPWLSFADINWGYTKGTL